MLAVKRDSWRARVFRVVRNPDELSTLPYLVDFRCCWPASAEGQGHLAAHGQGLLPPANEWPADEEIVEEVVVRSCVRRGVAVDLVLDRSRRPFTIVLTTLRVVARDLLAIGRTTRRPGPGCVSRPDAPRPALDLSSIRGSGHLKFTDQQATTTKRALPVGDTASTRRRSSASSSARPCRTGGPSRRRQPLSRSASWRRARERRSWSRTAGPTSSDSSTSRRAWSPRWSPRTGPVSDGAHRLLRDAPLAQEWTSSVPRRRAALRRRRGRRHRSSTPDLSATTFGSP